MKWLLALLVALFATLPRRAEAHGFSPALLEITEEAPRRYRVAWTVARPGETVDLVFADECRRVDPTHVECELAGTQVRLSGLAQSKVTALVRFVPLAGAPSLIVAEGASDVITLPAARGTASTGRYLRLGFEHVLNGFDHLLFVLCLAAWVRAPRAIVWVLSAFTVAHSLTLAAAVLDVVRVPSAPVEVCIAASVLLLAAELRRRRGEIASVSNLKARALRLAFAAGLLHGLGFAGALTDLSMPRGHVAGALLAFNVGVELGQIAFVGVLLLVVATLRRTLDARVAASAERLAIAGSGCVAAYALVERAAALLAV